MKKILLILFLIDLSFPCEVFLSEIISIEEECEQKEISVLRQKDEKNKPNLIQARHTKNKHLIKFYKKTEILHLLQPYFSIFLSNHNGFGGFILS